MYLVRNMNRNAGIYANLANNEAYPTLSSSSLNLLEVVCEELLCLIAVMLKVLHTFTIFSNADIPTIPLTTSIHWSDDIQTGASVE